MQKNMVDELTKGILKEIGINAVGDILLILRHVKKVCLLSSLLKHRTCACFCPLLVKCNSILTSEFSAIFSFPDSFVKH